MSAHVVSESQPQQYALLVEKCGFDIPVSMDSEGFSKSQFIEKKRDPVAACKSAHWAVRSLCEDKVAKPVVQEKIKKISCKPGKDGDLNMTVTGGDFSLVVGPTAKNVDQKVIEYLKTNL